MVPRPPQSKRPDTRVPSPTLFRSSDAMNRIDRSGGFATETAAEAGSVATEMRADARDAMRWAVLGAVAVAVLGLGPAAVFVRSMVTDRKSTRLNSSH